MDKLSLKQIEIIEVLTGTYGIEHGVARQIAIDTNGDMTKALFEISIYKQKNDNEM